jgi:hypothetical protein
LAQEAAGGCRSGASRHGREQDKSEYRLTDEQLAEVRRRRMKNDPNRIPLDDAFKRFRDRGA